MEIDFLKDLIRPIYGPILKHIRASKKSRFIKADVKRVINVLENSENDAGRVIYLGITAHSNLGDMAQYFCIHNWLESNYPDRCIVEIEADTVVDTKNDLVNILKRYFGENDIIVFQSGYTTQDLGGVHDLMHRMIIEAIPEAKILMMPQTIYFKSAKNEKRSAEIYDKASNMLFLARDKVSYGKALSMMPNVTVRLFPDIVTSLIGSLEFKNERKGAYICQRNDSEKYYSDVELGKMKTRLQSVCEVFVGDTTIKVPFRKLRENRKYYIEKQIEEYSKYKVVITDRYHGTIFSLAAGTPVVIIKTNDHKVITGADWFKGIYDGYVYVAEDLNDAYEIATSLLKRPCDHKLKPYFLTEYYDKLKDIFDSI